MMPIMRSNRFVPEAVRERLLALQQRYCALVALLPTLKTFDDMMALTADELESKLTDIELVALEMDVINAAQRKILDDLGREPIKSAGADGMPESATPR